MEVRQRWRVVMKNNIDGGGVMPPVRDPFDPGAFYVSDGWGSYYGSMRLRRLSLETGEELASALIRDCARCIWVEEDAVYAVLNKRLMKLARPGLEPLETWKKVPNYADHVAFDGTDTLLMMNWQASFLSILRLGEEKARRKGLQGGCLGIFREDPRRFLVLNGEGLFRYSLDTGALQRLADAAPWDSGFRGADGSLFLLRRVAGKDDEPAAARLRVYPAPEGGPLPEPREYLIPWPRQPERYPSTASLVADVSPDGETIRFQQDDLFWLWSLREERTLFTHAFGEEYVAGVFDDGEGGLTAVTYRRREHRLSGWAVG